MNIPNMNIRVIASFTSITVTSSMGEQLLLMNNVVQEKHIIFGMLKNGALVDL
ncbi:hypothetical protein D3C76_40160 [compost metagenome]